MIRCICFLSVLLVFSVLLVTGAHSQSQTAEDLNEKFSFQAYEEKVGDGQALYSTLNKLQLEKYHEYKMEREANRLLHVVVLTALAFGTLVLVIFRLGWNEPANARYVVNVTGLILIIYGTIVLTQMAETEQQLTAAIGILGAVAGYLFGTFRRTSEPGDEPPAQAKQAKPSTK